jgi:outer membrane protein TolC
VPRLPAADSATVPVSPAVAASQSPAPSNSNLARPSAASRYRFVRTTDTSNRTQTNALASATRDTARLAPPYRLNFDNIVQIVYARNATVRASREEMLAGKHALAEFRANLSRLEPYVETRSAVSDFPNRRDAFGNTVESVVGVKKESFGGAVLSTEVGASHSRFSFGQPTTGGDSVESGAGALVRARLEMPFFGSRRRQDRIIAQAFQDSTARKAQLDYLKSFRAEVEDAVSYYNQVVFWQRDLESSERWMAALDLLLRDPRLRESDRQRIETARAAVESSWNRVKSRQEDNLGTFLAYLGALRAEEVEVEIPDYQLSSFVEQAREEAGVRALIERARINNPAFRILNDAIKNAQLQLKQAIRGRYDVTTFLEGTTFPLGSETFDNRYQGWTVGGGINIRLNDSRVLKATRLKSEAQIRQFEAQMEAEEIAIQQKIVSNTTTILGNDENRKQLLSAAARLASVFETRRNEYFAGTINIDQLLIAREDVAKNEGALITNLQLTAEREALLALAIGQVYEMVGLNIDSDATEGLAPSEGPAKAKPAQRTQEKK